MPVEQEDVKRLKVNANTRLHAVLSNMAGHQQKQQTVSALALALGIVEDNHDTAYLKSFAVLYRMLELAEREQKYYLHDEIDVFQPSLNVVRSILNPVSCAMHWEQRKPPSWDTNLAHIFHAGQRLKKVAPECELRNDELTDIVIAVDDLRTLVEDLTISEVAKQKLRERCSQLRMAIEEYRFWGVEGIEVTFESVTSAMVPLVEKDENGKLTLPWTKIGGIALAISTFLGNANSGYKNVHDSLLLLAPVVHEVEQHAGPTIKAIEHNLTH